MSDSDASGENEQEKTPEVSPRPSTAAARRERRSSTRPAGKSEAKAEDKTRPAGKAKPGDKTEKAKDAKGAATPKRDRKAKQASPFARLVRFIREVWAELRKVIWPNRKQMVTYTAVVLIFVVFMVALVSGLDLAFKQVVGAVFGS